MANREMAIPDQADRSRIPLTPDAAEILSERRLVWLDVRSRAGIAQLVERQLPKLDVASSNLVSRSI